MAQDHQRKVSPAQSWILHESLTFAKGDDLVVGGGPAKRTQLFPIQRSMVSRGQESKRNGEAHRGSQRQVISNDRRNVCTIGLAELNYRLPTLKRDLSEKRRKVRSDLEGLPKSFVDNPQAHLLSLCNTFSRAIDSYTNGKPNYPPSRPTFLQDNLTNYRALKREIERTRPQFEVPSRIGPPQPFGFKDDDKKEGSDGNAN